MNPPYRSKGVLYICFLILAKAQEMTLLQGLCINKYGLALISIILLMQFGLAVFLAKLKNYPSAPICRFYAFAISSAYPK